MHKLKHRVRTQDSAFTYDAQTVDSIGNFFVGELERLDPTLHEPLASVTWGRDIDLREDVGAGDDLSSFTRSAFGMEGGTSPSGINWVGDETTSIPSATVDLDKVAQPLRLAAYNLSYTLREIEKSMKLGRPVDQQKLAAIRLKHQMDIDQMVYVGDSSTYDGAYGLTNGAGVSSDAVTSKWATGGAAQMQADILDGQQKAWQASGYAVCPSHILLPPAQYALLNQTNSTAGTQSVMTYIKENNPYTQATGRALEILPVKWLAEAGASKADRAVFYTKDVNYIRYPLVPLQRSMVTPQDMWLRTTYWSLLGQVEFVYPETVHYKDGI
ncbi:DUF2184 domain-containing protein [Acetobacter indonesiensis]|uniref:DUF2184 domain-containing protein n=1 Tax=Acetobacter indonesiensis TaxID=104101 RepID=UPI0039E8F839